MIRCDNVITEEHRDSLLVDKLLKESSDIIYKALTALKSAIDRGYRFTSPHKSTAFISKYKAEKSSYLRFYQECCVPRPKKGKFDSVPYSRLNGTEKTVWNKYTEYSRDRQQARNMEDTAVFT